MIKITFLCFFLLCILNFVTSKKDSQESAEGKYVDIFYKTLYSIAKISVDEKILESFLTDIGSLKIFEQLLEEKASEINQDSQTFQHQVLVLVCALTNFILLLLILSLCHCLKLRQINTVLQPKKNYTIQNLEQAHKNMSKSTETIHTIISDQK